MGDKGAHVGQFLGMLTTHRASVAATIRGSQHKTGRQVVGRVTALANGLMEMGLKEGDVVAIAALNSDLYLEWLLAIMCAGCIVAPLNYRWSFEEASLAVEQVDPVMLVVDHFCIDWSKGFMNRFPNLRFHVFLGPQMDSKTTQLINEKSVGKQRGLQEFELHWAPSSIALICFTSGTTGNPKGVGLSHSALIVQSLAKIEIIGYTHNDIYLHTSPLCHIGGISSALALLMAGGCHVFLPKFEAASALLAIEKYSVSAMITVPTMLADIVSYCDSLSKGKGLEICFSTVKKILNGGGSLSPGLMERALELFPSTHFFSAYGMTETCSSLTFMVIHDPALGKGVSGTGMKFATSLHHGISGFQTAAGVCVGKPPSHVEIQIETNSKYLHENEAYNVGSILTRGPHVMEKYWGQEAATAAVFSNDGWLNTGDVGWMDKEGKLWLLGRSKDMIKSGGENVYPSEVEKVLMKHPGVLAVVVVGLPNMRLNEIVTTCIQLQDGWQWKDEKSPMQSQASIIEEKTLSPMLLQVYCKQQGLSGFKAPRIFIPQREQFPRTTTGKVKRDEVRTQILLRIKGQSCSELSRGRSSL
eukprot:Gb_01241 [translate_table: standard]